MKRTRYIFNKEHNEMAKYVWSDSAIDYSQGVVLSKDGQVIGNKTGCWVLSIETIQKWLREDNGKDKSP